MNNGVNSLYGFGEFRFCAESRVLWRGEEMISLPAKAAEVLWLLVKNEGKLVTKQEIFSSVWADTFVEDGVLTQNIYTLRNILGVDENGRQFIENFARRGYRFAAPIRKLSSDDSAAADNGKQRNEVFLTAAAPGVSTKNGGIRFSSPSPQPNGTAESQVAINQTPRFASARAAEVTGSASRYVFFSALGVFALFTLGFGIYQLTNRDGETRQSELAPIEQLRFQRLTDSGDVIHPTISPDGEYLAYVKVEGQQRSVWVKQIATDSSIQTRLPPSPNSYRSLAFSPDGNYLFFRDKDNPGAIYQTPFFGSTQRKVAVDVWSDFSVSPDGRQFAFVRRDAGRDVYLLVVSNIDGSGERELSERKVPFDYIGGAPGWSPDGTKLVVAHGSHQEARPVLATVDVATGQETELKTTKSWRRISRTLWMPDGRHLIMAARAADEGSSQLWMIDLSDGEVRRLTNDLEDYYSLSLSADGQMLATRQQKMVSHLWLLADGEMKNTRQLTFGERNFDGHAGLAWTPDDKIIFTNKAGRFTDLYSMNPDGSDRIQLTVNAGQDNAWPTVSADSRSIVFTSNRSGARQLWRMDVDGRNQKQLTFGEEPKETAYSAALSRDGAEVFFIKQWSGPKAIWKVPIEGGTPVPVSRFTADATEDFLAISPDGKWLAYRHVSARQEAKGEDRTMSIGVMPTDGIGEPKIFDLPIDRPILRWSANSEAFYYFSGPCNSTGMWRQPLAGGSPQKLIDFPDCVYNFAWSPEDKKLVVASGKIQGDAILISNLREPRL